MTTHNPVTTLSEDSATGNSLPDRSTNGVKHVADQSPGGLVGTGSNEKISTVQNVKKTVVTVDGVINAVPAYVYGIHVNTVGTSIVLHDNDAAAAGESLDFVTTAVGTQVFPVAIEFDTGVYADITGGEVVVLTRPIA